MELGLTGALVGFGATNTEAVAATLIYRAVTILPTLVLGLLAGATWKIGNGTARRPKAAEGVGTSTST